MSEVERVKRQVIENTLFAALDDESKVAILCTKEELDTLIYALELAVEATPSRGESERMREYCCDIQKLREVLE